jgi:glycosyltransferase involved in cell wall biosynthesis
MKIAHIAPPWIPIPPKTYGGTESVLFDLVEEQVALGLDVTLFAPQDATTSAKLISFIPKSLRQEGAPWSSHPKAFYHLYKSIEAASAADFDIIHTHISTSDNLYIFPLTARLATPHVSTLHSNFPFDHVQGWTGDADNYYLKSWASAVPIIAISEHARREAPSNLNIAGVVHNGLQVQNYVAPNKKRGEELAWLGRFMPEKGPHLAIEAAKAAQRTLVLAGTIDRSEQVSVRYFHDVIEPQLDQQQIRYIGPVNRRQKIKLLSHAYGFLNPIQWEEPFGMVMIEAMVLGCPVISFERGAAPELIINSETGFLVHDVDEMVQAIPQLADLNRQTIRQHVEHNFSARVMAEKYMKIYQKIIATSKPKAVPKVEAIVLPKKEIYPDSTIIDSLS